MRQKKLSPILGRKGSPGDNFEEVEREGGVE